MQTGKVKLIGSHVFRPASLHIPDVPIRPEYSATFLIPKSDTKTVSEIKCAIDSILKERKGTSQDTWMPLRDGDEMNPFGIVNPAHANCYVLSAKSSKKPKIVDLENKEITDESKIYPGCFVRLILRFYPFDFEPWGPLLYGVGCLLNAIQKIEDAEPIEKRADLEAVPCDLLVPDWVNRELKQL